MSGKGSGKGGSGSRNNSGSAKSGSASVSTARQQEPTIVTGWEYHQYSQRSDRYQYIGKDEDTGEPEFLDFGPKGGH